MDAESKNDVKESITSTDTEIKSTKKKKGVLSRLWGAIFRLHGDDFEKRLQYISKEEAAVLSRITRRSNSWRRMTRHLILFSVLIEIVQNCRVLEGKKIMGLGFLGLLLLLVLLIVASAIAVGYAIMTTRSLDLNWKMRALRVLPMFLLPVLSSIAYFTLRSFTRMFDRKDHKTLEKLRAERQAKIDELKEKTNYYTTQQLIQRYDPDPAAKAAAATVLASKLGADSGLKVYVGDDSKNNALSGKSNDVEVARSSGLRNRKQPISNTSISQNASTHHTEDEMSDHGGFEGAEMFQQHQMVVEHRPQAGSSTHDGGWIARLAALLVGEDPEQSYALICGNCHMHNGLARKEDFPFVTYYCPHCHALNRPRQSGRVSGSNSSTGASSVVEDVVPSAGGSVGDTISAGNSPVAAVVENS